MCIFMMNPPTLGFMVPGGVHQVYLAASDWRGKLKAENEASVQAEIVAKSVDITNCLRGTGGLNRQDRKDEPRVKTEKDAQLKVKAQDAPT